MNELVLSLTIGPTPASAGIDRLSRELLTISGSTSVISVLSVSPILGDHEALDQLLHPSRWTIYRAQTIQSAVAILKQKRPPLLLCERDLGAGTWKEILEEVKPLVDPPLLIVASRLADEHLWAEALNLGAYDVLAKPFDAMELTRTLTSAWMHWCAPRAGAKRLKVMTAAAG
jgi:DNA-binding NtrC family response regulator